MTGWIPTRGIQTRMSRYGYTRASIFFFRIVLLSCRKEEHDQSGRGFLSVGSGSNGR